MVAMPISASSEFCAYGFSVCLFIFCCRYSCSDLAKVQAGLADKLALLFQWVAAFFAGFAVAFAVEWRLSLLILGMTPFLIVIVGFTTKVTTKYVWWERERERVNF